MNDYSNVSKDGSFFKYEGYNNINIDKNKIRQNINGLKKSSNNSRSVSRDYSRDASKDYIKKDYSREYSQDKITKANKDNIVDNYYFSFGLGLAKNKEYLSQKDKLKDSFYKQELTKSKSNSKLKSSHNESQRLLSSQSRHNQGSTAKLNHTPTRTTAYNSKHTSSSNNINVTYKQTTNTKSTEKDYSLDKTAYFSRPLTEHYKTSKYDSRDLTPQKLVNNPTQSKSKDKYISNDYNNTDDEIFRLYKRKAENSKATDFSKSSHADLQTGLDYSFSKKNYFGISPTNNLEGSKMGFVDNAKGSTSGTQSTYHLEDNKASSKQLESIEEKQFHIIAIIQDTKRSVRVLEMVEGGGNPYETVQKTEEIEL
jgi:hypothetical protein